MMNKLLSLMVIILLAVLYFHYTDDSPVPPDADLHQHGVPGTLGEYTVLAVFTPEDIACMPVGQKRIVLQARQGNVHDYLEHSEHPLELLKQLPDTETRWQVSVVGPGATLEKIQANLKSWNAQFENRPCMKLGGPVMTATPD
jgi:hypothetical protein